MTANYLALGGLIIARVKEMLPGVPCSVIWSLVEIQETKDPTTRVQVLFDADLVGESTASGLSHGVTQTWTVLAAGRTVDPDVGELITRTINALAGWKIPGYAVLKRVSANLTPDRSAGGVYYFPLNFAVKFGYQNDPQGQ